MSFGLKFHFSQISSSHGNQHTSVHDPENSMFSTIIGQPSFRLGNQIENMDFDDLIAVFDNLSLNELLQVAAINETLREIISNDYLIALYAIHERTILVASPTYSHDPKTNLKIEDPYVAAEFLRLFGTLVTKIVVLGYEFSYSGGIMVTRSIANNCNNLVDILIEHVGDYLVTRANHTFPLVKRITFIHDDDLELTQLHRIYPAVEQLAISLSVPSARTTFDLNIEEVRRLLPRIPQLRALTLSGFLSNDLLQSISVNLPVLEELRIVYDATSPPSRRIHFKNVKTFSITPVAATRRAPSKVFPISFDGLEALSIHTTNYSLVPIKLIEDSEYLESFSLPLTRDNYGIDYIVELLMRKKYLEKVTLRYWMEQRAANTISLISSFHGIDQLTFVMWDERSSVLQRDILISLIPDDWRIKLLTVGRQFGHEAYYLTIVH